nr:DNA-binding protein [uncultured Comamonas sp.]
MRASVSSVLTALEGAPLRTSEQVRALFNESGVPISDWARERGFSVVLTRMVIAGKRKCLRGQSHQIAVELGMKRGKLSSQP